MSRYRKIEVKMWGDSKFRSLSSLPPCGQGLWLYLLTGPHTGPIPGLFKAGRAGMAEDLEWSLEAFDKAFQEVFREGMAKADFQARVIWVPKAIFYNFPESPNVVKSWGKEWDLIPECDLKNEAYTHLETAISGIGETFAKAFRESFGKASGKAKAKAKGNQEQEQDIKSNNSTRTETEIRFIAVFENKESNIKNLYPHASYEAEKETCIAHYANNAAAGLDPYLYILKWFNRIPKGENHGTETFAGSRQAVRDTPAFTDNLTEEFCNRP